MQVATEVLVLLVWRNFMSVSDIFGAVKVVRVLRSGRVMAVNMLLIIVLLCLLEQVPVPISQMLVRIFMIRSIVSDLFVMLCNDGNRLMNILMVCMMLFNRVMLVRWVMIVVMIELFIDGTVLGEILMLVVIEVIRLMVFIAMVIVMMIHIGMVIVVSMMFLRRVLIVLFFLTLVI